MFTVLDILINLIDVLLIVLPVLLAVAFMTIIERKQLAAHQRRVGPVKCLGKALFWGKLSNSGDALKLLIPSHIRKYMSGWSNYPCMVTSQEMLETKMGYRGSKSEFIIDSVKEQRVDGSWSNYLLNNIRSNLLLRCTLMGFERNYQVKIPSKQIKNYSTSPLLLTGISNSSLNNSLNPWFITGFTDAEGSLYPAPQFHPKMSFTP